MINKLRSYDNDIDFVKLWRTGAIISVVAVAVCLGALGIRGLNLGIDFEGGDAWEVIAPDNDVADVRDVLEPVGAADAKIQLIDDDIVRVQTEVTDEETRDEITDALGELGAIRLQESVGPTWGDEITAAAQRALVFFFVLVAAYIAVRLEWKMAVGALVAVVHDIVLTVGVYALFQFEVTPATVIAFLTILGYSLYDTIVVFDKLQENTARPAIAQKLTYTDLASLSLNQVLMRSLNTSITSVLPVLSMLLVGSVLLGAVTLQEFALALLVGLLTGAYSSIFVATPIVALLKEREPYHVALRTRLDNQAARKQSPDDGGAGGGADDEDAATAASVGGTGVARTDRVIPPRPRKKGKKR